MHLWSFIIWKEQEGSQHLFLSLSPSLPFPPSALSPPCPVSVSHSLLITEEIIPPGTLSHLIPHSVPTRGPQDLSHSICRWDTERTQGLHNLELSSEVHFKVSMNTLKTNKTKKKKGSFSSAYTSCLSRRNRSLLYLACTDLLFSYTQTTTKISSSMHCGGSDLVRPKPWAAFISAVPLFRKHRVHQEKKHSPSYRILNPSVDTKQNSVILQLVFRQHLYTRSEINGPYTWAKVVGYHNDSRFITLQIFWLVKNITRNTV